MFPAKSTIYEPVFSVMIGNLFVYLFDVVYFDSAICARLSACDKLSSA